MALLPLQSITLRGPARGAQSNQRNVPRGHIYASRSIQLNRLLADGDAMCSSIFV
jgi:hypothetical protein